MTDGVTLTRDDPAQPTEAAAAEILRSRMGLEARSVVRFSDGLCHFVYDVTTRDGATLVVRLTTPALRDRFVSALGWHGILTAVEVPLPSILFHDVSETARFPVIVMERLPGTDLGNVYTQLPEAAKTHLATGIAAIQARVTDRIVPPTQ